MPRQDAHNHSCFFKPDQLTGVSLMEIEFTNRSFAPHWHEALVVGVTEAGGSTIRSRGAVEHAGRAALFAFNPGEPHEGWMGDSRYWRYRSFYLTRSGIEAAARALGLAELPYFTRNRIDDPDLAEAFLAAHRLLARDRDPIGAEQAFVDVMAVLVARHGNGCRPRREGAGDATLAERILKWMGERHSEALRLKGIAEAFGLTQFQLIALFNRQLGMSPHACLVQIRLNRACHLLRLGTPPAEAAVDAGFYDQSALGRHFKRSYGITPLQYARAVRH